MHMVTDIGLLNGEVIDFYKSKKPEEFIEDIHLRSVGLSMPIFQFVSIKPWVVRSVTTSSVSCFFRTAIENHKGSDIISLRPFRSQPHHCTCHLEEMQKAYNRATDPSHTGLEEIILLQTKLYFIFMLNKKECGLCLLDTAQKAKPWDPGFRSQTLGTPRPHFPGYFPDTWTDTCPVKIHVW